MTQKFANNFSTTVAATFGAIDTQLTLASVAGLPSLTGGHTLLLTVYRLSGVEESGHEVVEVTGISGNIATVTRAVEGAAASQFLTGDRVELRITAGSMQPLANHVASTSNPHNVTATQVGLGSVNNTSDANKPVSTAQQTALDGKQATLVSATNIKTLNGNSLLGAGDIVIASGSSIPIEDRSSNTMLVDADKGKFINFTAGTFTQTFGTLTANWYAYLKNEGTGEITIAASDGRTNWIMYPNELRLFIYDGTVLRSEIINAFQVTFTTSGNFIKPPGYSAVGNRMWGAGASGAASRYISGNFAFQGGAGGACHEFSVLTSTMSNTEAFVIGAGGTGTTAPNASITGGNAGGNSTFCGLTAYGGAGSGYGGAGSMSAGTSDGSGGAPHGGVHFTDIAGASSFRKMLYNSQFGGGKSGVATNLSSGSAAYDGSFAGDSHYGGAGAGSCYGDNTHYTTATPNGKSIYGGTAGRSIFASNSPSQFLGAAVGTTKFGGAGGAADLGTGARIGTAGAARGGGGGAACSTNNISAISGAGGRGELQIWGVI